MKPPQPPTSRRVLHYLLHRGEPAIVPEIAAALGVSHSAVRCAVLRNDLTFVEAGRMPGKFGDGRRQVLWAAWEW